MTERSREWTARLLVTIGALLPYWRLLSFGVIYVTDDRFTSDIFDGELPGRVLAGQMLRHGHWPVWTSQLCSGIPMAGTPSDPIGLAAFSLLPTAPALDAFVIVLLLVAAHGAFSLARRFGANRTGAVLAGVAFAGSGYIAAQLKHLGIVSTVVWLPVGLWLLDRAFGAASPSLTGPPRGTPASAPTRPARRALFIGLFGLVFAEQVLCGFPQSAYICGLVYAPFALILAIVERKHVGSWRTSLVLLAGVGLATLLAAATGAIVLLPLAELGGLSDRSSSLGLQWASSFPYWPANVATFFLPYVNGDISNNTYFGPSLFWEDYGYVGLATMLLAFLGAAKERRRWRVAFAAGMTVVAFLLVLGPFTPVFHLFYAFVPGMNTFRFPTRFLILTELGLAVLAAVGLTRLTVDLERSSASASRVPLIVTIVLVAGTALDLFIHQPRQNPMVPAAEWLAAPATVAAVNNTSAQPRTYTPGRYQLHWQAFTQAHGWVDLRPYFDLRDLLEPNTGAGYWNTPSADCYAGISPRWSVDVWGDHSREGLLMRQLSHIDTATRTVRFDPALPTMLRTYGVTNVITPYPATGAPLTLAGRAGSAYVYQVDGAARVRFVSSARLVANDEEAANRLMASAFDPNREVLLDDAPESAVLTDAGAANGNAGAVRVAVTNENDTTVAVSVDAPEKGYLLLADTYYPGWIATVDGRPTPIYRADISLRSIQVPQGHHDVVFSFQSNAFAEGKRATLSSVGLLLSWLMAAAYLDRRAGRMTRHDASGPPAAATTRS